MNQEPVDVNALISGVVDLYRSANPEAEFDLSLDDRLPPVSIDAGRFRQVFNNLIKNALEAHANGTAPHIRVSTREHSSSAGQHVEIRLADEGEGSNPT